MARTISEKERAAEELAARLANRDRSNDNWRDAAPLRRVAEAFAATVRDEAELAEAVQAARDAGFSWSAIGTMLGVSKQTAQARYGR
jgi:FAD/FMN-containing dehydrogenase